MANWLISAYQRFCGPFLKISVKFTMNICNTL